MKITTHDLSQMTITELSTLNQLVIATIKAKRGLVGAQTAQKLKVEQEVTINHKDHQGTVFIVEKINRTKAVCRIKDNPWKTFNIPLSLIVTE